MISDTTEVHSRRRARFLQQDFSEVLIHTMMMEEEVEEIGRAHV
jgi:hypothetical protein